MAKQKTIDHSAITAVISVPGSARFKRIKEQIGQNLSDQRSPGRFQHRLPNGYIESFNGKLFDKLLDGEVFDTLLEAKVLIERYRVR